MTGVVAPRGGDTDISDDQDRGERPDDRERQGAIGTTHGHFRIVDRLGRGGMGVVYKAIDLRLDRTVALKFLPSFQNNEAEARSRFMAEARAASALDDPNICTLYDIGESDDGQMFIAMAYYEGETLADKIRRGPLPLEEALDYASQIARGLAKAHAAGIVHRDVKPANVIVTEDGIAKILDFGLAKLGDVNLTKTGDVVGTVQYMSPEHTSGGQVDHRTDLWSLGVILYEMLAGEHPFGADGAASTMYGILHHESKPLHQTNPRVPLKIAKIVEGCLSKDPARRYQTADDLLADLERGRQPTGPTTAVQGPRSGPPEKGSFFSELRRRKVYTVGTGYLLAAWLAIEVSDTVGPALNLPGWATTAVVWLALAGLPIALVAAWALELTPDGIRLDEEAHLRTPAAKRSWTTAPALRGALVGGLSVLVVGVLFVVARSRSDSVREGIRSLVVLPLDDLSGQPGEEFFSEAMTDALIADLSKIDSLRVISRTSAMSYKDSPLSPQEIARELNVDAAIEGTVFRADDEVRINIEMRTATDGDVAWGESYEAPANNVLGLQRDVARAVADGVRLVLTPALEARLAAPAPVDTSVTNPYFRGRSLWWRRTPLDLQGALRQFEQAVARSDSTFAPALAGLADTYGLLGCCGYDVFPPTETMPKAGSAARAALALDSTLAAAHTSLAWVAYNFNYDWRLAERELLEALRLDPGYSTGQMWLSGLLGVLGRPDEAISWARQALDSDPVSLIVSANLGLQYYNARNFAGAIEQLNGTLDIDPRFAVALLWRGRVHLAAGDAAAGLTDLTNYADLAGRSPLALGYLSLAQGRAGEAAAANRTLRELQTQAAAGYVSSFPLALAYLGLEDMDSAFLTLDRALVERSDYLIYLGVDAIFDPMRDDPRFNTLLDRIGLTPAS